jgi:hypothetical protein
MTHASGPLSHQLPKPQQHAWILAGDDRGVYGEYPPMQIA